MRRIVHLSLFCLAAVVGACEPEQIIETRAIPTAGVRFINAVPDTGAMDLRFVDLVESNAHFNTVFRNNAVTSGGVTASTQIQFKNARAGQRHFRIFLSGNTAAVASTVVKDTTVTLEAGKLYTAIVWGSARAGATPGLQLKFFEETPPDPGSNVALRVINATSTAVDVRQYPTTGTVPAAETWPNLPGMSISSYVTVPPSQIRFNVRERASGNPVVADALALIGTPKTVDIEALPGTTIPGSAVTMIIFPGSVVGSTAPQTAPFIFTTGSTTLYATASGFGRPTGSFVTDGFLVGTPITVTGFGTAGNNGAAVITAVRDGPRTPTTPLSATATGYARATGSFLTDGFAPGMQITAAGFTTAANNGRSTVVAVTATSLDVTKATPTVVEAAGAGRSLVADATITVDRVLVAEASASGRLIVGPVTGRPAVSFIWDRRPPR